MNKIMSLTVIIGALTLPTIASAAGDINDPSFKNKGQCQSALVTTVAQIRQADTSGLTPSELNAYIHEHVSCQQNADGTWSLAFS
jgi:hypothetical protein